MTDPRCREEPSQTFGEGSKDNAPPHRRRALIGNALRGATIDVDYLMVAAAVGKDKPIEDAATVVLLLADNNRQLVREALVRAEQSAAERPDDQLRRRVRDTLVLADEASSETKPR